MRGLTCSRVNWNVFLKNSTRKGLTHASQANENGFQFPEKYFALKKMFPLYFLYFWQNDWHVGLCVSSQCWLSRLKNSFLVSKDAHQLLDVLYMNRHFSFVYMQCFVWGLASSTHPMNMSHFGISPESSCTAVGWTPEIPLRFLQLR